MREFVAENGVDGLAHLDGGDAVWNAFGVTQQRTYVYINDDGTWRTSGYGSLQEDVEGLIAQ